MSQSKAERTRNMRYKRPALDTLGYDFMVDELYEIANACADVQWFVDNDRDTLLNALDGDDEAEYEFRMAFSDLSAKADQLHEAFQCWEIRDYFDDCTVALIGNRYKTLGFDSIEEDYYSLTGFEQELAYTESGKKLMRKTKQEMISVIGQCLGIVIAFLDLRHSYDYFRATMDILRDENTSLLKIIKEIDNAYEAANNAEFSIYKEECKRFDILVSNIPDKIWLE